MDLELKLVDLKCDWNDGTYKAIEVTSSLFDSPVILRLPQYHYNYLNMHIGPDNLAEQILKTIVEQARTNA